MTCSECNTYTWHWPATQFMLISLCAAEIGNKYRLGKEWAGTFLIFFFAMFRIWAYGGSRPKHSKWRCFHKQRVRYNVVFNWVVHCMEGYDHLKGKPLISAAGSRVESTRLPPMCPGFNWETLCHMWVEFVVCSLHFSKRFFSGYSGFFLSSKTNISKFRSWKVQAFLNKFLWPPWFPLGKQITFLLPSVTMWM